MKSNNTNDVCCGQDMNEVKFSFYDKETCGGIYMNLGYIKISKKINKIQNQIISKKIKKYIKDAIEINIIAIFLTLLAASPTLFLIILYLRN